MCILGRMAVKIGVVEMAHLVADFGISGSEPSGSIITILAITLII
jgi:hypothetical protein